MCLESTEFKSGTQTSCTESVGLKSENNSFHIRQPNPSITLLVPTVEEGDIDVRPTNLEHSMKDKEVACRGKRIKRHQQNGPQNDQDHNHKSSRDSAHPLKKSQNSYSYPD